MNDGVQVPHGADCPAVGQSQVMLQPAARESTPKPAASRPLRFVGTDRGGTSVIPPTGMADMTILDHHCHCFSAIKNSCLHLAQTPMSPIMSAVAPLRFAPHCGQATVILCCRVGPGVRGVPQNGQQTEPR